LLDLGEEALFGGEKDACAVGVDGAAFEDDAVGLVTSASKCARRGPRFVTPASKCARLGPRLPVCGSGRRRRDFWLDLGEAVEAGDLVWNLVVAAPVRVFGPGVELPVGDGEVSFCVLDGALDSFNKNGAGVAEPDAVGGPVMEVGAGEVGAAAAEDAGGAALGGEVVDEDVDVFDAGEMADDLSVDPGDGLEFSGPVVGVVGPRDPGCGVGRPLGGHAVSGDGHGVVRALLGHGTGTG
jgi:hypothetical protein